MSIFRTIKRSLGFGGADDEDDVLYADTATSEEEQAETLQSRSIPEPRENIEPVKFDAAMQQRIFDQVLNIFNKTLPEFVSSTVDKDAQAKYLLDALDSDIRQYLDSLSSSAEKYCETRWQQARNAMASELESLKTRNDDIEKKSSDLQQKQLSIERQKRALSERVHDLEAQLARLEAEREQYELENRSLVNRLKVANVNQEDVQSYRDEIDRLKLEMSKLQEDGPKPTDDGETTALKTQIEQMTEGMESLKEQVRVSAEMLDDMRHRVADATKELEQRDNELAEAKQAIASRTKELEQANSLLAQYDEITKKMEQVDEVMTRSEAKIKSQRQLLASREAEIEALRKTISENIRLQAEREKEFKRQIEILNSAQTRKPTNNYRPTPMPIDDNTETSPKISEEDLSAIEQTFESEEWLSHTPPAPTPSMRPEEDSSSFGYQEPKRRRPTTNPDQLSLF